MTAALNAKEFDTDVLQASGLVLVDFWADWCPPCRALSPILDQVASDAGDSVVIRKLDIEAEQSVAIDQQITALPTVKLYKDGVVVKEWVGLHTKNDYLDAIKAAE